MDKDPSENIRAWMAIYDQAKSRAGTANRETAAGVALKIFRFAVDSGLVEDDPDPSTEYVEHTVTLTRKVHMSEEYQQQREAGAKMIAARLQEEVAKAGLKLVALEWDQGNPIRDKNVHRLVAKTSSKSVQGEFPDEQLADYPGQVGTEYSDGEVRRMVAALK